MKLIAVDTSLAVPLLVSSHTAHADALAWAKGRCLALCGHALIETYSVLTRLPGDARLQPSDAVELIDDTFQTLALTEESAIRLHRELAAAGIAGGAVYDALVGAAAKQHGLALATRDARAIGTYEALGAPVELVV